MKPLTEVSCLGTPSLYAEYKDGNNAHKNPFGTEVALFKTSEGGMSRMAISWDMKNAHGEQGRVYGQKPYNNKINGARPALPPGVAGGRTVMCGPLRVIDVMGGGAFYAESIKEVLPTLASSTELQDTLQSFIDRNAKGPKNDIGFFPYGEGDAAEWAKRFSASILAT